MNLQVMFIICTYFDVSDFYMGIYVVSDFSINEDFLAESTICDDSENVN